MEKMFAQISSLENICVQIPSVEKIFAEISSVENIFAQIPSSETDLCSNLFCGEYFCSNLCWGKDFCSNLLCRLQGKTFLSSFCSNPGNSLICHSYQQCILGNSKRKFIKEIPKGNSKNSHNFSTLQCVQRTSSQLS